VPVRDDDLTRALRESAPSIDTTGALERVRTKRARRRRTRTARLGAFVALAALLTVGGVVLLSGGSGPRRVITPVAPVPGATPVALTPDHGYYLRGPLVRSGGAVSVAGYDAAGRDGFAFPPSRIVRFDPDTLRVIDSVPLKAEILSVAEGADGVRWAVTRNQDPEGPVTAGTFLKRITADGVVTSRDLPPGTEIDGDVAVVDEHVVVPTTAGVLTFDLTGRPIDPGGTVRTVPLTADVRSPAGFAPQTVRTSAGRTWIEGRRHGEPTAVLVDGSMVRDVITLPGAHEVSFLWVDDDTVLATANGRLLRIHVDR
jgi:hypothetical protein